MIVSGLVALILFILILGFSAQRDTSTTSVTTQTTTQTPRRGSLDNPAIPGEPVTVRAYGRTFEVTVLDFIRGKEASEEIELANIFNPSPDTGHEYVLVKVKVSYVKGEERASIDMSDFKAFVNGKGYSPRYFIVYPADKPEFKSVTMLPGASAEGWILFEVPMNREVFISFSYLFSGPLCFIKLEKPPKSL